MNEWDSEKMLAVVSGQFRAVVSPEERISFSSTLAACVRRESTSCSLPGNTARAQRGAPELIIG